MSDKTNVIGAADELLLALAPEGRVVTADALLTQRALAQAIVARGGVYLLAVKGNQPGLRGDIELLFGDTDLAAGLAAAATVS